MSPCRAAYNRASWCADALVPAAAPAACARAPGTGSSRRSRAPARSPAGRDRARSRPELLLEFRIVRELEGLGDVRLQIVLGPDALHRRVRDADMAAHAAHAPAAAALGRTRGLGDDASDFGRGQGWLAAPPAFVRQPFEPR